MTDQNGAVIPNVKISAENTATGVVATAVSNNAGVYLFPSLPPGVYRVAAEQTGFQRLIRNDVLLEVGGKLTLNLTLTIGNASETVEVKSNPADTQLGYQTSSVGNVVTGKKLLELPLQGRNALDFISLQAGVVGDNEGDEVAFRGFNRTLRDRSLDKRVLNFNRTHLVRVNGIWELPFGKGRFFGKDASGLLDRLIGGWQVGGILQIASGSPVNITGVNAFNLQTADGVGAPGPGIGTPVLVGNLSKDAGQVTKVANGVVYFQGFQLVNDPWRNNIAPSIRSFSTMFALADANGNIILRNATPGEFGTFQQNYLTGPGSFRLDLNLIKRIRLKEGWNLVLRADAINATNTPVFANPIASINSLNFGNITATVTPPRVVVVGARIEF